MSVWGSDPRYLVGAVKNAKLAKEIFPDWEFRVYYDAGSPKDIMNQLIDLGANVIVMDANHRGYGMFWRFLAGWEDHEAVIFRDSDSRLSIKEKKCIDEWLESDKKYSVIRDHPRHFDFPIMGGMWGIKGNIDASKDEMVEWAKIVQYTIDQVWLAKCVWKFAEKNSFFHEFGIGSFCRNESDLNFIGQGYDENDNPLYPSK